MLSAVVGKVAAGYGHGRRGRQHRQIHRGGGRRIVRRIRRCERHRKGLQAGGEHSAGQRRVGEPSWHVGSRAQLGAAHRGPVCDSRRRGPGDYRRRRSHGYAGARASGAVGGGDGARDSASRAV
jgi:hypothetical protein